VLVILQHQVDLLAVVGWAVKLHVWHCRPLSRACHPGLGLRALPHEASDRSGTRNLTAAANEWVQDTLKLKDRAAKATRAGRPSRCRISCFSRGGLLSSYRDQQRRRTVGCCNTS